MKPVHSFLVKAKLPENIEKIKEIAYNYWWCWDSEAKELFNRMNRKLWSEVHHNPILLINKLTQQELDHLSKQRDFINYLDQVYVNFKSYLEGQTWFSDQNVDTKGVVAYFSPEYGINESFPVYSGGLGVLSGDHLKSASDLGLPLIGVGLLYQQGYFRQRMSPNGWQNEQYPVNDFYTLPMFLIREEDGRPKIIDVDMPEGKAYAQIWKIQVGRTSLYLLDSNIEENQSDEYKNITDQLYGGDRDTRIQQEILLGIGGIRALHSMGIIPTSIHINEGHAAFALIEQSRICMNNFGIDFYAAMQIIRGSSIFTTHTPVPAGNEAFSTNRIERYFKNYIPLLNLSKSEFIALGQIAGVNYDEAFSMTVLGLKFTGFHNGVSKLHGLVSKKMWKNIWKDFPEEEVPIDGITNGIHTTTWLAREFSDLFDRYLQPNWKAELDNNEVWKGIDAIPSDELWREKQRRRIRLVLFAREYIKKRQKDFLRPDQINKINNYLDPDALTIGFARRFATYKRPFLIFSDMNRLKQILTNKEKQVQILLAGKAHPHDTEGKQMIQSIIQKVRDFNLENYVVFLEDYDMVISRLMVKGCDIWLNNPIRPLEASGTSGMKAAINGTLNCSILDGWWDEAYDGTNGFAIGSGEERDGNQESDQLESELLYDLLENQLIPMFYDRGTSRVPSKWVDMMKSSMKTITPQFSTQRMVKDYAVNYYFKALENGEKLRQNGAHDIQEYNNWRNFIYSEWSKIEIASIDVLNDGEAWLGKVMEINSKINLGGLQPNDVTVQIYFGIIDPHSNEITNSEFSDMQLKNREGYYCLYSGTYTCDTVGKQGFTIRVLPKNKMMIKPTDLYICKWAN
jgi:starch phosphorylase